MDRSDESITIPNQPSVSSFSLPNEICNACWDALNENEGTRLTCRRMLAWMIYIKVPEKGGETEFLRQSRRIEPVIGRTLIWPAYFTHIHRGNSPLKGEKYYITGWFENYR